MAKNRHGSTALIKTAICRVGLPYQCIEFHENPAAKRSCTFSPPRVCEEARSCEPNGPGITISFFPQIQQEFCLVHQWMLVIWGTVASQMTSTGVWIAPLEGVKTRMSTLWKAFVVLYSMVIISNLIPASGSSALDMVLRQVILLAIMISDGTRSNK